MKFSKVIGQEKVKSKLIVSVKSGRIPHAQLFFGPEGCGSLPLAIAYAQFVSCLSRNEDDSCGICPSCRKFEKLAHPDLHFSFPVNTSKTVSTDPTSDDYIETWREFVSSTLYFKSSQWYQQMGIENKQGLINKKESEAVIRKLNLKSFESDYKFLILWLPEKMNATSANMLLKLVEEPPEKTLFLFVSENPDEILVTISSRTQPIKLDKLAENEISEMLIKKYNLSEVEALNTARLSSGNFIAAIEIQESSEEKEFNFNKFTSFMRLCYMRNIPELNNWIEEMASAGREQLKSFFIYAVRLIRENFMMNLQQNELVYLNPKEADFSKRFYPYINGRNILPIYNEFNSASYDIERNANAKIVLFDMALKIVKLIRK